MALFARTPPLPLSRFVATVWLAEGYVAGPHRLERIMPTGSCDLIVDLRASGGALVSGPHSESFVIETSAQVSVAGAQFKPGGALPFFALPMDELRNLHVPLGDLWGSLAAELRERLAGAATPDRKLAVIEQVLRRRLTRVGRFHDGVAYALHEFEHDPEVIKVADVIDRIGISHRRFLDLFTAHVGLRPKVFCRIRRFQRVLEQIRQRRHIEWADVALSCGYYDQAHFIKEFHAFSGVNPSTYVAAAGAHPNHMPIV